MGHSDIGYLLNRATRQFRRELGDALGEIGLRPQQAAALIAIAGGGEGRMAPSVVAESIDTDAATTSGLLDRLVRDGWVTSGPNPNDGRSRLFELTDKAKQTLPQVMSRAHAVSAKATACLTSEELETLRHLLLRLSAEDRVMCGKGDWR